MARRNRRWIDRIGPNMIRIVIGSYFMAISLGLIQGVDQRAIFAPLFGQEMGDLLGTTVLFAITMAFMSGLHLGVTSIMLAMFVMASSIMQNFVPFAPQNISAFWRDLTLVCGGLLSYFSLKPKSVRPASLIARRYVSRVVKDAESISPRRVSLPAKAHRKSPPARTTAPVLSAAPSPAKGTKATRSTQCPPVPSPRPEISQAPNGKRQPTTAANAAKMPNEDVVNIFAEG